jgi:DNA-binding MltR family transcriptional regulator
MLQSYLVEGETSRGLLQPGRPLGEFSARRQLCYCLGLITRETSEHIELIGRIRNEFAHDFLEVRFTDSKIAGLCNQLLSHGWLSREKLLNPDGTDGMAPRERYSFAVLITSAQVLLEAKDVEHRQRKLRPPCILLGKEQKDDQAGEPPA